MSIFDKLPKIPFLNSSGNQGEYYFALNIGFKKVTAAVWGLEGKKMQIISVTERPYSHDPSTGGGQDLIEASNYALDEALADFEPEPTKVLFGVPDSWLQDDNLKEEYLKVLRHLVKELDITPMAFVSTSHAISHYLQNQQGVPVTAVLVEISDPATVAVVKAGKIVASKKQKRTANLPEDIEKALLSFPDVEVLPSKILLYGDKETARLKDELQSYSWMAQLPFLHLPKIEHLEPFSEIISICFAGAFEINPNVSFHPKSNLHVGTPVAEVAGSHLIKPHQIKDSDNLSGFDEIEDGFVEGDVKKLHHRRGEAALPPPKAAAHQEMEHEEELALSHNKREVAHHLEDEEIEQHPVPMHHSSQNLPAKIGQMIMAPLSVLPGVGGAHHPGAKGNTLGMLKWLAIPIVLLAVFAGAYFYFPKAKVKILVDMQVLERDSTVIADPTITAADEVNKKIPGRVIETQVEGSGKGSASGKKKIGDPAKGTVIIYNKTSGPKTFSQGTTLEADGRKYTLDTSVNIASQSAVDGGIAFGKATANVTASDIGPEGNLPAGRELSVSGQSGDDFSAKVDQAFSGGVSKDVTVVTSDDQKKLLAQVASDLRKKAREELQTKLTSDLKIIEEGLSEQIISQNYSKKVGDQANDFNLTMSIRYKGTAYSDSDLKAFVSKLVETNVPEGFELDLSQTETQSNISKVEKDGKLVFTAKFRAKLKPKLDTEQIRKELAGKSQEEAAAKLKELKNVVGSEIEFSPPLPGPLARLPFMSKNITVEVAAK